jgi:hypothetical protein
MCHRAALVCEQVPGLPAATTLWHAHPVRFIEHLAKCMWLSKNELELIYPEKIGSDEEISHGTPAEMRENYPVDINKCCYRYGIIRYRVPERQRLRYGSERCPQSYPGHQWRGKRP